MIFYSFSERIYKCFGHTQIMILCTKTYTANCKDLLLKNIYTVQCSHLKNFLVNAILICFVEKRFPDVQTY